MPLGFQSRLPDALDALVRIFGAAEGLDGVTVRDGASVSKARVTELLSVGYTGMDSESDADSSVQREGLGPEREQLSIRCAVAVLMGGTDLAAARRRVYELFGAAAAAVAAHRTLGGVVMDARIASHALMQGQTDQGAQAVVQFTIACDAYARG